jgi:hypothetical protein
VRGRQRHLFDQLEAFGEFGFSNFVLQRVSVEFLQGGRGVPGHFPELVKEGDKFVWTEATEFPLLIR